MRVIIWNGLTGAAATLLTLSSNIMVFALFPGEKLLAIIAQDEAPQNCDVNPGDIVMAAALERPILQNGRVTRKLPKKRSSREGHRIGQFLSQASSVGPSSSDLGRYRASRTDVGRIWAKFVRHRCEICRCRLKPSRISSKMEANGNDLRGRSVRYFSKFSPSQPNSAKGGSRSAQKRTIPLELGRIRPDFSQIIGTMVVPNSVPKYGLGAPDLDEHRSHCPGRLWRQRDQGTSSARVRAVPMDGAGV